jgi:hypothetical protein
VSSLKEALSKYTHSAPQLPDLLSQDNASYFTKVSHLSGQLQLQISLLNGVMNGARISKQNPGLRLSIDALTHVQQ